MDGFYILKSFGGGELPAIEWMYDKYDVTVTVPLRPVRVNVAPRHKDKVFVIQEKPVVPGYVFMSTDQVIPFMSVDTCPFVSGYLYDNGVPAVVAEEEIHEIERRVQSGFYDDKVDQNDPDKLFNLYETVLIQYKGLMLTGAIIEFRNKLVVVRTAKHTVTLPVHKLLPARFFIKST